MTAVLCIIWGMAITVYNIAFQHEILITFPENSSVAMSLYSGIFNLGIGAGAYIGGVICDHALLAEIGYIGAAIALAASTYILFRYLPSKR